MVKRFRKPKMVDGELKVYWGKTDNHDDLDVVLAWQGDASMKQDMNLLYYHLCSERPDLSVRPLFSKMQPSLIEELKARGYDITTIKFSIMKKAPVAEGDEA